MTKTPLQWALYLACIAAVAAYLLTTTEAGRQLLKERAHEISDDWLGFHPLFNSLPSTRPRTTRPPESGGKGCPSNGRPSLCPLSELPPRNRQKLSHLPEVAKRDCQHLVDGELAFNPTATMTQGEPYILQAQLSLGRDLRAAKWLNSSTLVVESTQLSCKVSVVLDSQEDGAFKIDKLPTGREDAQMVLRGSLTQWDWRVTPQDHGVLHLLLYVTPVLYTNNYIGLGLKEVHQSPRVITVDANYAYAIRSSMLEHWAVWATLSTGIIMPFLLWWLTRKTEREVPTKGSRRTVDGNVSRTRYLPPRPIGRRRGAY